MKGVLITGGTGGIGSALVRQLRAAGRPVTFTYKTRRAAALQLQTETGAEAISYDASQPASVDALCQTLRAAELEGLVNLASDRVERSAFLKLDCELVLQRLHREALGPIALCQAFAARCKEAKSTGAIVNVLSSYVLGMPPEKMLGYVMLKHALLAATRCMAVELVKHGIRVNAVSPGMTRTDYLADLPERFIEMAEESLPMKRIAKPEEVASTIAFLLSQESSYINGANLPVTGGAQC
jgi:3-oxoacyl-[acyl-carrier protein] reductase